MDHESAAFARRHIVAALATILQAAQRPLLTLWILTINFYDSLIVLTHLVVGKSEGPLYSVQEDTLT